MLAPSNATGRSPGRVLLATLMATLALSCADGLRCDRSALPFAGTVVGTYSRDADGPRELPEEIVLFEDGTYSTRRGESKGSGRWTLQGSRLTLDKLQLTRALGDQPPPLTQTLTIEANAAEKPTFCFGEAQSECFTRTAVAAEAKPLTFDF